MKRTLGLALLIAASGGTSAASGPPVHVPNFALLDQDGASHELTRTDARVIVVSFLCGTGTSTSCGAVEPLKAVQRRHAQDPVAVWPVSTRLGQTRRALAEQARGLSLDGLPLLHDGATILARALGASRIGDTFIVDRASSTVVFRGSIDGAVGGAALEQALNAALKGKATETHATPVGGASLGLESAEAHAVSYEHDVAPLIARRCVRCHRQGEIAPFAFSSYQQAKGWSRTIQEVLLARRMPPWSADAEPGTFSNDVSLTLQETDLLWRWIEQGTPRAGGPDPLEVPLPPVASWPLGKPDLAVTLPAPQAIPATGVIPYQRLTSTFVMPRDAWLKAALAQPDNHAVVHHITVYPKYPDGYHPPGEDSFLTGWAPGMIQGVFPGGTGKFVPKGTAFTFEVHYTPNGKPQTDLSRLGLYLSDKPLRPLETRFTWDEDLVIPAGDPNLRTQALYGFRHDAELFDLIPHMHNRGTWVKYEALYPDGRRETLLSVPRYDFAWQSVYSLAHPKHIPAGTWLLITARYDNSSLNPANPNPKARVHWGEQTWDEMFVPQFDVVETPPKAPSATAVAN